MADEAEVARLTGQIAEAMLKANRALEGVAHDFDTPNLPRSVERRLEDIDDLDRSAGVLRERETESRNAEGVEATGEADRRLRTSFEVAQETAGRLSSSIQGLRTTIETHRADLASAASGVVDGLNDVDSLEQLSGVDPATTAKLREGLNGFKNAAENARNGLQLASSRLDTARVAADQLAVAELPIDNRNLHSNMIGSTAETARTQLTRARAGLEPVRADVFSVEVAANQAVTHGIQTAEAAGHAASEAAKAAANTQPAAVAVDGPRAAVDGASPVDPELAHAMNAGITPGPAAGTADPATPKDPRLDYMMPARTHEAAGQRDDRGSER